MNYIDITRIHRALNEAKRNAGLAQALVEQAREAALAAAEYASIADALLANIRPS